MQEKIAQSPYVPSSLSLHVYECMSVYVVEFPAALRYCMLARYSRSVPLSLVHVEIAFLRHIRISQPKRTLPTILSNRLQYSLELGRGRWVATQTAAAGSHCSVLDFAET